MDRVQKVNLAGLTKAIERLWSFLQHLAGTGKNRRTTQSTPALVIGMIRATVFWLLWATIALLRILLRGLRMMVNNTSSSVSCVEGLRIVP